MVCGCCGLCVMRIVPLSVLFVVVVVVCLFVSLASGRGASLICRGTGGANETSHSDTITKPNGACREHEPRAFTVVVVVCATAWLP